MGTITSVVCEVDQTELLHNDNVLGDTDYLTLSGIYQINYQYTGTAQNLSSGMHKVTISVNGYTLYAEEGGRVGQYDVSVSDTYYFMLNTPPTVNLLSIQNRTYNRTEIPLIFQVDTSKTSNCDWLGFSLDNQANVTINGNSTLTALTEGNHSLVVYANDSYGNMGNSDTIYFSVDTTPPNISDISSEQASRTSFQLNFTVNEPTSWMGYSLDNEANVTLAGNTTIDARICTHNIIIYANSTDGNMGASDLVQFQLQLENFPSPTPTQQPTQQPIPSVPEFPTWTALPIVATATLLIALVVRRKKQ